MPKSPTIPTSTVEKTTRAAKLAAAILALIHSALRLLETLSG